MNSTKAIIVLLVLLAAPCSLLAARCSLFAVRCSLLAAPSLIVVVSFDQMRGDFAARFAPFYQSKKGGGFGRLQREGLDYKQCYYRHASNITGPGHASLLTGCYPAKTGIVGNDFCDGASLTCGYCVRDDSTTFSARNLKVPTLSDALRVRSPKSKTVSIALKDRAAILMAGHSANACLWVDAQSLMFETSAAYPTPTWLRSLNARVRDSIAACENRAWSAIIPVSLNPAVDSVSEEGSYPTGGTTFPHVLPQRTHEKFAASFLISPFSMNVLFDAAMQAMDREKLGKDRYTDILCIGVSSTDYVGHVYGPDSREIQELYVHADMAMERLIHHLDKRIGRNKYLLVVTSDHGVAPIPELIKNQAVQQRAEIDAGRISRKHMKTFVDSVITSIIGPPTVGGSHIRQAFEPSIYLELSKLDETRKREVIGNVVEALRGYPGLGVVASSHELAATTKPSGIDDSTWKYVRMSYHEDRSGDIVYYPKRYWIIGGNVTTHGTPHDYDQWVPLMMLGGGVVPRQSEERVAPVDIAPTLGKILGIEMPGIDGRALELR